VNRAGFAGVGVLGGRSGKVWRAIDCSEVLGMLLEGRSLALKMVRVRDAVEVVARFRGLAIEEMGEV
jgi:hypothetical protein